MEKKLNYARPWTRFQAMVVDIFIIYAIALGSGFILGLIFGAAGVTFLEPSPGYGEVTTPADAFYIFVIIVVTFLYYVMQESSEKQATIGKKFLKLKVVDYEGKRVSFARAAGRYIGKIPSSFFYIGYIMVFFTKKKQGLHDLLAKTYVVQD